MPLTQSEREALAELATLDKALAVRRVELIRMYHDALIAEQQNVLNKRQALIDAICARDRMEADHA